MIRKINSLDNHHIKLAASLRQKKFRDSSGLFLVEGIHLIQEVLMAGWSIEFVLLSEVHFSDPRLADLLCQLEQWGHEIFSISGALFQKAADTETPQGLIAVVRQPRKLLTECSVGERMPLWLILDAVQDPGNVGTLVRNADAAGASGVLLTTGCADIYAGKTVRASMGSLFHLPVIKASTTECLDFCRLNLLRLYVADGDAKINYTDEDLAVPCAIVLGNEGSGVGSDFKQHACAHLRIPIGGLAESLNVASAAAVILFEAARQRGFSL